jgi:hypothetical protein
MSTNNKTDTSTPSGAGGSASVKTDSTASAKAAARKKQIQQQQKNQKSNPATKKKTQPQVVKSSFEGIASGVSPMKGIVIAQGNGNMAGQFRMFQKKLAGAAADDKAYGLDSAIMNLTAKKRTDFVKPKPDPSIHSNLVPELDSGGKATGGNKLVCHNPALKEQMDAEYNMDLKFQSSNWNQYNRMEEGYYRTAIGNMDSDVLTYCRMDKRMALAEKTADLIMLLLVVRSVCAQNHGAVKVDEEYHNLTAVHSAACFRQKKNVNNSAYADEVLDRYESAIFTSGKFVFGQTVYDRVLANYHTPMTFKEYINMSEDKQAPVDEIVKERTVARLIVKNSLNNRARNELLETYSVTNNTCYPNTISEALSLLATFKSPANNNPNSNDNNKSTEEEALVSYHETTSDSINAFNHESTVDDIEKIPDTTGDNNLDIDNNVPVIETTYEKLDSHVRFDETVMAAVIAEATAEAEDEQFFGASFDQLQTVEDAYEDNEPDIVCCVHLHANDEEDTDDNDDYVSIPPVDIHNNDYPNPNRGFELVMYHTSQRINNLGDVYTFNYDSSIPNLISYNYDSPTPGAIIDYADAIRLKLKLAGIHDTSDLMAIFEGRTDTEASHTFRQQLEDVEQQGFKTSTVRILREETMRHVSHTHFNILRYQQMIEEIGEDVDLQTFPKMNVLLHHVVSAVAINQRRHKPNRWVNRVTHKLIKCEINTIEQFETKLNNDSLNECLRKRQLPRFHQVTIQGFKLILGTADFRQGRF